MNFPPGFWIKRFHFKVSYFEDGCTDAWLVFPFSFSHFLVSSNWCLAEVILFTKHQHLQWFTSDCTDYFCVYSLYVSKREIHPPCFKPFNHPSLNWSTNLQPGPHATRSGRHAVPEPTNPLTLCLSHWVSQQKQCLTRGLHIKKKNTGGKSTLLIMIRPETEGKCITVSFYIRVLSRCLSATHPPPSRPARLPPRVRARLSNTNKQIDALLFLALWGPCLKFKPNCLYRTKLQNSMLQIKPNEISHE